MKKRLLFVNYEPLMFIPDDLTDEDLMQRIISLKPDDVGAYYLSNGDDRLTISRKDMKTSHFQIVVEDSLVAA